MRGHYIKTKTVHVSIPEASYRRLQKLAEETGRTIPGYVRYLLNQEFVRLGLPWFGA